MDEKLDNPPLVYALAQVVFNPIKGMGQFVPGLQDVLRSDFPDFKEEAVTVQHFPAAAPPGVPPQTMQTAPQTLYHWHFLDFEQTSGYTLTENSLNFHTTAYETSHAFLGSMARGVELIHQKVNLAFVERLALRYVNAIYMSDQDDAILHPSLRGMVAAGSDEYLQIFSESVLKKENNIQLLVRAVRTHHGFPRPDGLERLPLSLRLRQPEKGESMVGLDLDGSRQKREKFDMEFVNRTLPTIHAYIKEAFFSAVERDFFSQEK